MLFWIIVTLLALAVGAMLATPLWRGAQGPQAQPDLAIYRDQLAEVERDLARGVLDDEEAARTRAEVARRLLAADRAGPAASAAAPAKASRALAVTLVLVVACGTGAVYWGLGAPGYDDLPRAARLESAAAALDTRMSQAEAEAQASPPVPEGLPAEYLDMIAQLRLAVAGRPDDLTGWQLLSEHEARVGDYAAAARAQARVVELKGFDSTPDDMVAMVDRMVAATEGFVSPEAEDALRAVLARDPGNLGALYYMGLLYAQFDRPDVAFNLWQGVIQAGATGTIYDTLARAQIEDAAFAAGVEFTLPPERGPSAADMQAAGEMAPEDRQAMIEGMVAQLGDRLATDGGSAQEWAQLITALGVLERTDQARAIWTEAQGVFAADATALATVRAAAEGAGVAQ